MIYTYDWYIWGLFLVTQCWSSAIVDDSRFSWRQEFIRGSVGGFEVKLPTTFRTVCTKILYLDSDLFICRRENVENPSWCVLGYGRGGP